MKKVSTRAAAQRRNISQQKLTIGLGLDGMRCTLPSYRRAQGTDKKETGNEEG